MRICIIAVAYIFVCTLFSYSVYAEPVVDDSTNQRYLFTLASTSGTYEGNIITLKRVPTVVYFSDRPTRISGHLSLESFLELWDDSLDNFRKDPPNAEFSMYQENGDKHSVLIISNPEIKGDNISFEVKLLNPKEGIPKTFGHSTLFIDNFRVVGGRFF